MWILEITANLFAFLSLCIPVVEPSPTPNDSKRPTLYTRQNTDQPPISSVQISNITTFGDGCPTDSGSVQVFLNPELGSRYIVFNFTTLRALTGSAISSGLNIISCNIGFTLQYPANWVFTVSTGIVYGNVTLPSSEITGAIGREYQWGVHPKEEFQHVETGPASERPFAKFDRINPLGKDFGICSTDNAQCMFALRNTVGLPFNRESYGEVELLYQVLELTWKECTLCE